MGLADLLVTKHAAIAKVVIPASMAFGFMYTLQHETNPLTDAKNAALGTSNAPVAYTLKRSSIGASSDNSG
ncbi:hypothetical protein ABBQ38_014801 [Trebouxia sp. C0009 RCD-2024]